MICEPSANHDRPLFFFFLLLQLTGAWSKLLMASAPSLTILPHPGLALWDTCIFILTALVMLLCWLVPGWLWFVSRVCTCYCVGHCFGWVHMSPPETQSSCPKPYSCRFYFELSDDTQSPGHPPFFQAHLTPFSFERMRCLIFLEPASGLIGAPFFLGNTISLSLTLVVYFVVDYPTMDVSSATW